LIIGICTFFYVKTLPNVFISETLILVEPAKIPSDYVRSTATTSIQSRLSTITQQIMSRTRLEKIILDNGLYSDKRKHLPMEDVVEGMRKDIDLKVTKSDAFTLAYQAFAPDTAQKVASQLASLYIEENLKIREEQTEGVSQFLDSELKQTEQALSELETRLSDFKTRNMGSLPEQQDANLAVLNGLHQQLQAGVDSLNRLEEQRTYQQRMLSELKSFGNLEKTLTLAPTTKSAPEAPATSSELETLRAQRQSLLRRYTKDHPDVKKLDGEIARAEKLFAERPIESVAMATTPAIEAPAPDMDSIQIKSQLDVLSEQIKQGQKEQQKIRDQISLYQARVNAVPRVEQMQKEISRDYEITKQHYQALLTKKNDAEMATNLEKRQKGEQFRVIDPASYPERPAKPDRLKLNLLGGLIGLVLGFLGALVFDLQDESIRNEHELVRLTGIPVLVTIPLILENSQSPSRSGKGMQLGGAFGTTSKNQQV